jgi:hypothetical protein
MDGVIFALVSPMVIKEFSLTVPEYRSGPSGHRRRAPDQAANASDLKPRLSNSAIAACCEMSIDLWSIPRLQTMINQVRHSDDRNRSRKLGGNAALLKSCAVPHCVVTSAALDGAQQLGRVWNPQSRPSRFRGAVSLDIMCIRQCNAVLASQVLKLPKS